MYVTVIVPEYVLINTKNTQNGTHIHCARYTVYCSELNQKQRGHISNVYISLRVRDDNLSQVNF